MQEIPCSYCGESICAAHALRGDLIDNMSRESYCSEECREKGETPRPSWRFVSDPDAPRKGHEKVAAAGKTITAFEAWETLGDMADPFAE